MGGSSTRSDPFPAVTPSESAPRPSKERCLKPLHCLKPPCRLQLVSLVHASLLWDWFVGCTHGHHCCSSHASPAGALLDAIAGCTLLNGTPCSGDPADAALAEEAVQCRLMLDSSLAHLGEGGSSLASGFMESMLVPGSQVRLCWLGFRTEHAGARVTGDTLLAWNVKRVRGRQGAII